MAEEGGQIVGRARERERRNNNHPPPTTRSQGAGQVGVQLFRAACAEGNDDTMKMGTRIENVRL